MNREFLIKHLSILALSILAIYGITHPADSSKLPSTKRDADLIHAIMGKLKMHVITELPGTENATTASYSPDGKYLATGATNQKTILWDGKTHKKLGELTHDGLVVDQAFSSDSAHLITSAFGTDENNVSHSTPNGTTIWSTKTLDKVTQAPALGTIHTLAYHPTNSAVILGGTKGAHIWDVPKNKVEQLPHSGTVYTARYSPDGSLIATGSGEGLVIWNAETQERVKTIPQAGTIRTLDFNHAGSQIATAADDRLVHVWNVYTGDLLHTLPHENYVNDFSFSPHDEHLLTGSVIHVPGRGKKPKGAATFWSMKDGKQLGKLNYDSEVRSVDFSPDGSRIAIGSILGDIKVWQVRAPKFITDWIAQDMSKEAAALILLVNNIAKKNPTFTFTVENLVNQIFALQTPLEQVQEGAKRKIRTQVHAIFRDIQSTKNGQRVFDLLTERFNFRDTAKSQGKKQDREDALSKLKSTSAKS